jgi:hypothetical protein
LQHLEDVAAGLATKAITVETLIGDASADQGDVDLIPVDRWRLEAGPQLRDLRFNAQLAGLAFPRRPAVAGASPVFSRSTNDRISRRNFCGSLRVSSTDQSSKACQPSGPSISARERMNRVMISSSIRSRRGLDAVDFTAQAVICADLEPAISNKTIDHQDGRLEACAIGVRVDQEHLVVAITEQGMEGHKNALAPTRA